MSSNTQVAQQTSPIVNKRRSIEELKQKYETSPVYETPKISTKPKSPKKLKKSKVKQMASMFNSKISQIIKRNDEEVGQYSTLVNEFSPEANPAVIAAFKQPVAKPRTLTIKPRTPVPTPRRKSLAKLERKPSACFVAEDVFAKLSVKAKAKLYTQFVEEISQKKPHLKTNNVEAKTQQGEVIVEKQVTVKDLLDELEFNSVFPKPVKTGTKALQRMNSMKKACAARKSLQTNKAQEYEDLMVKLPTTKKQKSKSLPHIPMEETHKQQLEDLFFSWFKLKHELKEDKNEETNQSEVDEEKQKSAIDKLLEEAIAKLETLEAEQKVTVQKKSSDTNSSSSSAKPSADEESESGLSSLPKNTSEDSQTEERSKRVVNSENDYEFIKPLKPLRKKKLRRNNAFKKETTLKELNHLTSTDSETDNKKEEIKMKPKRSQAIAAPSELHTTFVELNQSLMRVVNSPRKIKSAYTLTVNDLETPLNTPRSSLNFAKKNQLRRQIVNISLTDQGFETGANDVDSPLKRCSLMESEISYSSPLSSTKNDFGYSTPIKAQEHHSFANSSSAKQQLFSPIAKPLKSRRKSLYELESRRNSLAMQVIQEDQPYEPKESFKSNTLYSTEEKFITNNPTKEVSQEAAIFPNEKCSQFWINCGDFSIALEINFNDKERLHLLYEIFSQTSCDTKDLHFGIDDHKFSVHGPSDMDNISTRIPATKGSSHYWFSTGDLAIPFSGKFLTSHKIQRLFRIIKETVEETGILRFGVDDVEFSNVPELWHQPPKFSVDSQYSMLVGLQSGDSNGLEGRSKFAWPHSKPVMISDLDESLNEGDNFEEIESGRLSFSPFGSNHCDLASLDQTELSMPRNSQAMMNLESYCDSYESESLDQLFENSFQQNAQRERLPSPAVSLADINETNSNQQQSQLTSPPEEIPSSSKPSYIAKDSLDVLKGTPEYVEKLKSIVSDISNIGCSNNFKECSLEELESYMHFLSRYAEICLSSCGKHMESVLDALGDYKPVVV